MPFMKWAIKSGISLPGLAKIFRQKEKGKETSLDVDDNSDWAEEKKGWLACVLEKIRNEKWKSNKNSFLTAFPAFFYCSPI